MLICLCKGIKESEFSTLASHHGTCPEAMKQAMGLDDSCCGRCEANLETMIRRMQEGHVRPPVGSLVQKQEAGSLMVERRLASATATMEEL